MIYCAECDTKLDIDEDGIDEGEIVTCSECGTGFEIVSINPIELKPVEAEGYEEEEEEETEDSDYS